MAGKTLPSNTLVDGEIVIADDLGGSDFGALQARLGMARRDVSRGALQRPAVLLCFDLLTVAGEDLTSLPLSDRRHRLEHLVAGLHPCLQLMIQTDDWQTAQDWLTILTSVEGVVAKRADGHYVAGRQRSWIKVKTATHDRLRCDRHSGRRALAQACPGPNAWRRRAAPLRTSRGVICNL